MLSSFRTAIALVGYLVVLPWDYFIFPIFLNPLPPSFVLEGVSLDLSALGRFLFFYLSSLVGGYVVSPAIWFAPLGKCFEFLVFLNLGLQTSFLFG